MIYWLSSNFFLLYRRFKKWTPVTHHSTRPRFLLRNRKPPSPRSSFLAEEDKHSQRGGWQLFCFLYTARYINSFVDLAIFTSGLISLACCFPMILTRAFNNGAFLKPVTLYRLFNVFCLGLQTTAILCVVDEFWVRTEHFQENLYC